MSNEPTDVGPIAGGDLPVSQHDLAQASHLLHLAHADGRLTAHELGVRVGLVRQATTFDDLVPLTRDLVDLDPALRGIAPLSPAGQPGSSLARPDALAAAQLARPVIDRTNQNLEPDRLFGVFGGTTRKGHWRLRKSTEAFAVCGGHTLDLSEAVFEDDECTISVFAMFGGVEVRVPAGVRVVDHTGAVFGGTEIKGIVDIDGTGPVLHVRGFLLFGGLEVKGPRRKGLKGLLGDL